LRGTILYYQLVFQLRLLGGRRAARLWPELLLIFVSLDSKGYFCSTGHPCAPDRSPSRCHRIFQSFVTIWLFAHLWTFVEFVRLGTSGVPRSRSFVGLAERHEPNLPSWTPLVRCCDIAALLHHLSDIPQSRTPCGPVLPTHGRDNATTVLHPTYFVILQVLYLNFLGQAAWSSMSREVFIMMIFLMYRLFKSITLFY
jgi:hypothetical protein